MYRNLLSCEMATDNASIAIADYIDSLDYAPMDTPKYIQESENTAKMNTVTEASIQSSIFYRYRQNNPGGVELINATIATVVFIEASNELEADNRALSIGLYFNGVQSGMDCPCCGNRWERMWEDCQYSYAELIEELDGRYETRVHFADGSILQSPEGI